MTPAERAAREPVWLVLSDLYLDTELDDEQLAQKATILAESPYSIVELRQIELWEVAPVVSWNMLSIAGTWSGFDEGWICTECGRRAEHRSVTMRVAVLLGFGFLVRSLTGRYWSRLDRMITRARSDPPPEKSNGRR
jgi:hypothetical protein